ncbi:MAG: Gfo/Idh/MocA family oxidoreductase [Clostridiales bacterium]|nr:Gfo/Idh/MocA family oxidoreductase [Clostridiales bacterium]
MKEFGIGMIGFGFMGKAHTYGYKTIPLYYENLSFRTRLVGVCTSHIATAEKAKALHGFEFATTDYHEILKRNDIDIVHICTPNVFHKDAVVSALKAGKHVYCEKPLTISYSDAKEILSVLHGTDLTTQMTFQNRFLPAVMRAHQLIEEGRLGRILSFHAAYLHSGSVDPNKPIAWKQDAKLGGGGVLFDLGSHVLDMIYYLVGEYESIITSNRVLYPQRPTAEGSMIPITAEDQSFMMVKMKNQSTGIIEISKIATGTNDELQFSIYGDKGAIKFNLMDPNYLDFCDNTKPDKPIGGEKGFTRIETVQRFPEPGGVFVSQKASIGWIRGHVHSLYNFLQCVYDGCQASPSIRDGAYIQYVMEKAYESHEKSSWVTL